MNKLFACLSDLGISHDRERRHAWATDHLPRTVTSFKGLTNDELGKLIEAAERELTSFGEPVDDGTPGEIDQLWLEIFSVCPDGIDPECDISERLGVDPNEADADHLRDYLARLGS